MLMFVKNRRNISVMSSSSSSPLSSSSSPSSPSSPSLLSQSLPPPTLSLSSPSLSRSQLLSSPLFYFINIFLVLVTVQIVICQEHNDKQTKTFLSLNTAADGATASNSVNSSSEISRNDNISGINFDNKSTNISLASSVVDIVNTPLLSSSSSSPQPSLQRVLSPAAITSAEIVVVNSSSIDDFGVMIEDTTAAEVLEDGNTSFDESLATSSFGIRSFTVEVTTASEKTPPKQNLQLNHSTQIIYTTTTPTTFEVPSAVGAISRYIAPPISRLVDLNEEHAIVNKKTFSNNLNGMLRTFGDINSSTPLQSLTTTTTTPNFDTDSETAVNLNKITSSDHDNEKETTITQVSSAKPLITTKITTSIPMTSVIDDKLINESPSTEKEIMKNGMYRVKIAEIITDEFDNGLSDNQQQQQQQQQQQLEQQSLMNRQKIEEFENNMRNKQRLVMSQQQESNRLYNSGKINIADLYPSKLEDFVPIIKQSNEKLINEKHMFVIENLDDPDSHGIYGNKIDLGQDQFNLNQNEGPETKIEIELIDNEPPMLNEVVIAQQMDVDAQAVNAKQEKISDFTSELLQETDERVINTIEKQRQAKGVLLASPSSVFINHAIINNAGQMKFIDRRVKKFDPFLKNLTGNTKFNQSPQIPFSINSGSSSSSSNSDVVQTIDELQPPPPPPPPLSSSPSLISSSSSLLPTYMGGLSVPPSPEFSTTKFYNSKELYNELYNKRFDSTDTTNGNTKHTTTITTSTTPPNKSSASTTTTISNIASDVKSINTPKSLNTRKKIDSVIRVNEAKNKLLSSLKKKNQFENKVKQTNSTSSAFRRTTTTTILPLTSTKSIQPSPQSSQQTTLKPPTKINRNNVIRTADVTTVTRNLISSMVSSSSSSSPSSTAPTTTATTTSSITVDAKTSPSFSETVKVNYNHVTTLTSQSKNLLLGKLSVADTMLMSQSVSPHLQLSRLQEKINSLECDMPNELIDSNIWRGNETHELSLPSTFPESCASKLDCSPMIISWEGKAEIQSGDVLIVEIDDTLLMLPTENNGNNESNLQHKATTAVYQVTRPGHEHCDVTEGVLLDITPLEVDGKKLVTLYDKDLTEGVNLLIVVSELWGQQCVRLKVTVKSDNCGEGADCSGKGVCYSNATMEGYECQCCTGFAGSHCEEIDACSPSPCTNNGICVDLSQGHEGNSYQCLCPYGYMGKNCQFESDPCNPSECQNGGTCTANATHFRCECTAGYTGRVCQHNLNECESSPCVHGICVDQEDGFRCFCQPGFAGELCNFEYNECESNPCLNGAQCTDHIGGFSCKCTRGYTGKRCHIKVDFCANNPCPEGHRCNDRGDDFTCECPGGRNGPDCNQVPRTLCNVNPCANGGTCWTSEESFYCACRPGYTGKMCEDEFVVETVVSSNEILSEDGSTLNNIQPFGESSYSAVVAKSSPIGLHNAYIAAGTFITAIFIVAIVVIVCHCKFHQSYRRFTTRHHQLIPIFGFGRRTKLSSTHRHWLSGKATAASNSGGGGVGGCGSENSSNNIVSGGGGGNTGSRMPLSNKANSSANLHYNGSGDSGGISQHNGLNQYGRQQQEHRNNFNRHLAMNLENDMYYTVDFSDSQHSPLIR